jgi:hypothetical protein
MSRVIPLGVRAWKHNLKAVVPRVSRHAGGLIDGDVMTVSDQWGNVIGTVLGSRVVIDGSASAWLVKSRSSNYSITSYPQWTLGTDAATVQSSSWSINTAVDDTVHGNLACLQRNPSVCKD